MVSRTWAKYIYGKTCLSTANTSDGLHPNQTGHQQVHDSLLARYNRGGDAVNITPAPTNGLVDDTNNTFDWTNASGYTALSDYEYTMDGGTTVATVTAKPLAVGAVNKAVGQVGVRVKAAGGNPASSWLYNLTAFTAAAATLATDYVWHLDAGDAASITKDGSNVVSSVTLSGTGGLTASQSTSTKKPTYVASAINGLPAFSFDGGDALTIPYNPTLSGFTLLVVFKPNVTTGTQAVVEHTFRYGMRVTTNYVGILATANQTTATAFNFGGTAATTGAMVGAVAYSTGSLQMYFNKGLLAADNTTRTGDVFTSSTYTLSIGGLSGGTANYFNGQIAEIYFYNRRLTNQEIQDAATVLNSKYGL